MDSGREVMQNAEVSDLAGRTGVRIERDVRDHGGQQGSGPRLRAESYHSANSAQRDQRVAELERQVEKLCRALDMRGPPSAGGSPARRFELLKGAQSVWISEGSSVYEANE